MKKIIIICLLSFVLVSFAHAQKQEHLSVKTNLVGWAAYGSANLGIEAGFFGRWSLNVDGYYNPFQFKNYKRSTFWAVQPEVRFYFKRSEFKGHFLGVHGVYNDFDFGMKKYNYDGWLAGAGLAYGYSFKIFPNWNLEATLGAGWLRKSYDKNLREHTPDNVVMFKPVRRDAFGITKAAISVIYVIK